MPLKLRIVAVLLPATIPTFGTVTTSGTGPASADGVSPVLLVELLLLHAAKAMTTQTGRNIRIEFRCIMVPSTDMDRSLGLLRDVECHIRTGVATARGYHLCRPMLRQNEHDDWSVDRSSEFPIGWNTCV